MNRQYSKNGIHLTEQFEGLRLTAYPDPGTGGEPWTIGYGHTGPDVHPGLTITQEQAEELLMKDVQKAAADVNAKVTTDLTQEEFDALVDFVFNCGAGNFNNSTLLKKVNAGDMAGAAEEFAKWNKAAGHVLAGLVKRREAEAQEFLSGLNG
jgi:lysozyme